MKFTVESIHHVARWVSILTRTSEHFNITRKLRHDVSLISNTKIILIQSDIQKVDLTISGKEPVNPSTSREGIPARTAGQRIVIVAGIQHVAARASGNNIITGMPFQ
jgi:hypothetical protein